MQEKMTTLLEFLMSEACNGLQRQLNLPLKMDLVRAQRKSLWRVLSTQGKDEQHSNTDDLIHAVANQFSLDAFSFRDVANKGNVVDSLFTQIENKKWLTREVIDHFGVLLLQDREGVQADGVDTPLPAIRGLPEKNNTPSTPERDSPPTLRFVALDPFDPEMRSWLRFRSGRARLRGALVHPDVYGGTMERWRHGAVKREKEGGIRIRMDEGETDRLSVRLGEFNAEHRLEHYLQRGISQHASDIHLEPAAKEMLARMRIDGVLVEVGALPLDAHRELVAYIKGKAKMDVVEKRRPQDGSLVAEAGSKIYDVRVACYPTIYGEKVVMRLLSRGSEIRTLSDHNLPDAERHMLHEAIQKTHGLILVSGPTGSGKSTTLYSLLNTVDRAGKNVLTVEDPVEYRIDGVHQMQVNPKIELTFATGLRAILRQDPDIIMVGEIRDKETADMALQASLTGHLVFSTIHTNDAPGVVVRLINMGVPPYLVASSLRVVVAQRLVRTVCASCKKTLTAAEVRARLHLLDLSLSRLSELGIQIPASGSVWGAGCAKCHRSGYSGRRAVFEMFTVTDGIRELIVAPSLNEGSIRAAALQEGKMRPMVKYAKNLLHEGITTYEEILRVMDTGETGS
ncbi:MAG: type II/IV secretion system protein [Magnetococcales bacterium]|nr:type II/IV secretion system protein [Magnetococcales bacterium]MBF0321619.1 type II/IV secretion system protein [Magnetococcales bacterium]